MEEWMNERMNRWMDEWMYEWVDEWMDGWMDEWSNDWVTVPNIVMLLNGWFYVFFISPLVWPCYIYASHNIHWLLLSLSLSSSSVGELCHWDHRLHLHWLPLLPSHANHRMLLLRLPPARKMRRQENAAAAAERLHEEDRVHRLPQYHQHHRRVRH